MQSCRYLRVSLNRIYLMKRLSARKESGSTSLRCLASLSKYYSTEALPQPHVEGTEKAYSPKIKNIVEDISKLTLLEVADLNALLKNTLNIQDAPMMSYGGPVAAAAPQEEEDDMPAKKEKTSFTVKLIKFEDGKKVQLIKELKNLMTGMNLVQAKKFVESAPVVVKADISKDEAEQLKEAIHGAGGLVEVE